MRFIVIKYSITVKYNITTKYSLNNKFLVFLFELVLKLFLSRVEFQSLLMASNQNLSPSSHFDASCLSKHKLKTKAKKRLLENSNDNFKSKRRHVQSRLSDDGEANDFLTDDEDASVTSQRKIEIGTETISSEFDLDNSEKMETRKESENFLNKSVTSCCFKPSFSSKSISNFVSKKFSSNKFVRVLFPPQTTPSQISKSSKISEQKKQPATFSIDSLLMRRTMEDQLVLETSDGSLNHKSLSPVDETDEEKHLIEKNYRTNEKLGWLWLF